MLTRNKYWLTLGSLAFLTCAALVICSFIGTEHIDWKNALALPNSTDSLLLWQARLPRLLVALCVGAALSSSGAAYQALLRNPLADPFIMGVSGGAALGTAAAVGMGFGFAHISLAAFAFALLSMLVIFMLARARGRIEAHTLLLTGVIFNAFCFALILLLNAIAPMEQSYQMLAILIGNIDALSWPALLLLSAAVSIGLAGLIWNSARINYLALGDDAATSLGINIAQLRLILFFFSSLMVGASVAASGLVGFVGLFMPQLLRIQLGPDHRLLIPASALAGAAFLMICDTLARTVLMHGPRATQLPVGVITALIGAPCFFWLLKREWRA